MTAPRVAGRGTLVDAVREELDSTGAPYRYVDEEIVRAIRDEESRWAAVRRNIVAELKCKPIAEPVPDLWIVQGAANRLWDDLRLPFVFVRAEWLDQMRAKQREASDA